MSGGGATVEGAGVDEMVGADRTRHRSGRYGYGDGYIGGGEGKRTTCRGRQRRGGGWKGKRELVREPIY